MSRSNQNVGFKCENCGRNVLPLTNGSFRNHCPFCLYSKHVDFVPGDRLHLCDGMMQPVGVQYNPRKGYQIIHRCLRCGFVKVNKAATDTDQPDNWDLLIKLSQNVVK